LENEEYYIVTDFAVVVEWGYSTLRWDRGAMPSDYGGKFLEDSYFEVRKFVRRI